MPKQERHALRHRIMNDDVQICAPGELSTAEIQSCISLVQKGGALENPKWAADQLPRAIIIAIKRDGREIVGVGAIKPQRPKYAADKARKSGFEFDSNAHELGYVVVKESHRGKGISRSITTKLLSAFQTRPLFATTPNPRMKRTLKKIGFIRRGNEWPGKKGKLSLWIKSGDFAK